MKISSFLAFLHTVKSNKICIENKPSLGAFFFFFHLFYFVFLRHTCFKSELWLNTALFLVLLTLHQQPWALWIPEEFDFQHYTANFAFYPLICTMVISSKQKFIFFLQLFHLLNMRMIYMAKECQEGKHLGRIIWMWS